MLISLISAASQIRHSILSVVAGIGRKADILTLAAGDVANIRVAARYVPRWCFFAAVVGVASALREVDVDVGHCEDGEALLVMTDAITVESGVSLLYQSLVNEAESKLFARGQGDNIGKLQWPCHSDQQE